MYMVDWSFYEKKMFEALELLGDNTRKRTINLIYEKIKDKYDNSDLDQAIESIVESSGKINYPELIKKLNYFSAQKREQEIQEAKAKEEEETKRFWKENYRYIKDKICDRHCYKCKVKYCDIVSQKASKGIRDIIMKERTYEEVSRELALEFKGIGFEEGLKELEPF